MDTCKTCKHWIAPDDNADWSEARMCGQFDPDTHKIMECGFEVRICRHPAQTRFEAPFERNGFGLTDGEDYMAALATAEDFGCVRHEKEGTDDAAGIPVEEDRPCKVCGATADADGILAHGRGCYVLDENGGGSEPA